MGDSPSKFFQLVQNTILIADKIEQLGKKLDSISSDVKAQNEAQAKLAERVAKLEGASQGAMQAVDERVRAGIQSAILEALFRNPPTKSNSPAFERLLDGAEVDRPKV